MSEQAKKCSWCEGERAPGEKCACTEAEAAEAFFEAYAERSGTTVEALKAHGLDVFECECDADNCGGFQVTTAENRALQQGRHT